MAQRCDFCGSSALIPVEQQTAPIRPESLLEFKIPESQVRDKVREWYGSRWFAPNALKSRALTDTVHGVYLPYWTFDAQVHADWTAESGYHYYETEYYTDSDGKRQSRQVQHTRWEPSSGSLDHFFDDELVPASRGVPAELLAQDRALSHDHRPEAVRSRLPRGLGGGAVPDRPRRRRAAFARADGWEGAPDVRQPGARAIPTATCR